MDFPFDIQKHLPLDHQGFAVLDTTSQQPRTTGVSTATYNRGPTYMSQDSTKSCLAQIIDKMGEASSRAQGLGAIITSYGKFISSGDNRLYIKVEGNQVCGILKVGKKNLFYNAGFGGFKEVKPLCVLDFYVHESMQRKGVGKVLFEKMLAKEGIEPEKLAYDRPSSKFIAFLKKHYGLTNYTPQNNNFVIFNQYWDTATKTANTRGQSIDSIQDYRNKKFGSNQISQPTIPQKTETSIVGSKYKNDNFQEENKSFQSNLPPKPVSRVNNNTQNYNSGPSYPVNGPEQNNRSRVAFLERIKGNESQDTDAQMKAADEAFAKLKLRPDSLDMGKGKTQIWNVSSQQNYTSKAPWGSYGTTTDAFKSSSTYGSYYNQPGSNLRKK